MSNPSIQCFGIRHGVRFIRGGIANCEPSWVLVPGEPAGGIEPREDEELEAVDQQ